MGRVESKPVRKRTPKPHKYKSCLSKKVINLIDHPELVAFDDGMYKLEGELRSARKALYEYKTCPSVKVINLFEHPKLAALDEEMYKLEWVLHDGREALAEQVTRHATMKQHSNSVVDPEESVTPQEDKTKRTVVEKDTKMTTEIRKASMEELLNARETMKESVRIKAKELLNTETATKEFVNAKTATENIDNDMIMTKDKQ